MTRPRTIALPPRRDLLAGATVAASITAGFLLCAGGDLHRDRLQEATRAMRRAGEAGGILRAPVDCGAAQAALVRAEAEVAVQEKRSFLSRDYGEADDLVARAHLAAESCAARAVAARSREGERAARSLADLESWIGRVAGLARNAPDRPESANDLLQAQISLGEGRSSFAREQYERADEAASRGRDRIAAAVDSLNRVLDDFDRSPRRIVWKRWVRETLRDSRRDDEPVILVDKLRRQLLVMRGDDEIASYPVDLGAAGIDSKTRAGDDATPEGRYQVTEVRGPGQTHYYRALLLDYPNAEDRERFRRLQRVGLVSRKEGIGSMIEIHGQGGREKDWTQGCVALEDGDMDDLVHNVRVGTRVTIIGMIPDGAIP